jgi:hypothetical protein
VRSSRFPALALSLLLCAAHALPAQTSLAQAATRPRTGAAQRPAASRAAAEPIGITPEMRIVIGHINANSLRGHVSFLASDLL